MQRPTTVGRCCVYDKKWQMNEMPIYIFGKMVYDKPRTE